MSENTNIPNQKLPLQGAGGPGLIVILGAGESGVAAAYLAQRKGYDVFVSDFGAIADSYKKQLQDWNGKNGTELSLGEKLVVKK